MPEAGPRPVFRLLNQAALDRGPQRQVFVAGVVDGIAMHIAQLLNAFLFVMHVEIVIPPLPELNLSRPFSLRDVCCFNTWSATDRDDRRGSPTSR
jgi:hypothetical protein